MGVGHTVEAGELHSQVKFSSHPCFLGPAFNLSTPRSKEKPLSAVLG